MHKKMTKKEMIADFYKSWDGEGHKKAWDALWKKLRTGDYEYLGGGMIKRKGAKDEV